MSALARNAAFHFARFVLETQERRFREDERGFSLRPKTVGTLIFFAQHQGSLVTRDELLEKVWGDVVVTENTLVHSISACGLTVPRSAEATGYILVSATPAAS